MNGIWLKPNLLPHDLYPQAKAICKEIIKIKNNIEGSFIIGILIHSQQLQLLGNKKRRSALAKRVLLVDRTHTF